MEFRVVLKKSGDRTFQVLDQAGVDMERVDPEELRRRLHADGVGVDVQASIGAIRAIAGALVDRPELPEDVKHTLVLLDLAAQNAFVANIVEKATTVRKSEFRKKVLRAQRILAGDAPLGQNGIHVEDGAIQRFIMALLDSEQVGFTSASAEHQERAVARVQEIIYYVQGSRPEAALIREALLLGGHKGRPKRVPKGQPARRAWEEIYNDLLRTIELAATTPDALKMLKKRGKKKKGDT